MTSQKISRTAQIAVDYFHSCVALKKVNDRLQEIYKEYTDKDYDCQVLREVSTLIKWKQAEGYEYRDADPLNWYDSASFEVPEEVLEECFKLYEERKKIKAFKGSITRRLYLAGQSIETIAGKLKDAIS